METKNKKIKWVVEKNNEDGGRKKLPEDNIKIKIARVPFLFLFLVAFPALCYSAFFSFIEIYRLSGTSADIKAIAEAIWMPSLFLAGMIFAGYVYKTLKGSSVPLKISLLFVLASMLYFFLGSSLYFFKHCPEPADYSDSVVPTTTLQNKIQAEKDPTENFSSGSIFFDEIAIKIPRIISCPIMIMTTK